jgi:alkylation response protein AidB-like acyl-CoA dehydrogenase
MELEFTSEQDDLRDTVRSVLARECPMSLVREVVEKGGTGDSLWSQMVALGWPALTVPEEHGGLGLGMIELAVVVEELGRVVAPGPLFATATQFVPAIVEAGSPEQRARFVGPVAAGELAGTLAVADGAGRGDPTVVTAIAEPDGDGYRLRGAKRSVLDTPAGGEVVVVARLEGTSGDDGVGGFVVPRDDLEASSVAALDATRPVVDLSLDGVRVPADRVLGPPGSETAAALRRAVEVATTGLALEIVGACQTIFDVTLEYAKHREQFGVPIGSFQAIKHKFADMLISLERARATAYFAALTIAEQDERRPVAVSIAKAAAGECAVLLAKEGIQIHGGIGYTWEHDMHLWVRRVRSDGVLLGSAAEHRAAIAALIGL